MERKEEKNYHCVKGFFWSDFFEELIVFKTFHVPIQLYDARSPLRPRLDFKKFCAVPVTSNLAAHA